MQFIEALTKGYGKDVGVLEYGSPDFNAISKLTGDIFQFSAAKNWNELRDMTDALHDGNSIRPFDEYVKATEPIIGKYNQRWLRTEYNQALSSAQCSARWTEFLQNKKDMPYLQYQAVMDENTRDDHAALNGIIKRIDDPFWDKFYPPNGWGCRCEAIQLSTSKAKETTDDKIHLPAVPAMFRINFGKRGLAFPPGHPYYNQIPDSEWDKLNADTKHAVNKYYENKVLEIAQEMGIKDDDMVLKSENLRSGKLIVTKKSLRVCINHVPGCFKMAVISCIKNIDKWVPVDNPNIGTKRYENSSNGTFEKYNYYTMKLGDSELFINIGVERQTREEKLYAIKTKEDKSK